MSKGSYWQIFSKDDALLDQYALIYEKTKYVDPNINKIILIEKCVVRPRSISSLKLSAETVIDKFQGYEGNVLDVYPIEDNLELETIIKIFYEVPNQSNNLLLYVKSDSADVPKIIKDKAVFVGFDVGLCNEEGDVFSSIFHEILFGRVPELVSFAERLNENYLLPDRLIADEYVCVHDEMSRLGKCVEDYRPLIIYEIWKFKI